MLSFGHDSEESLIDAMQETSFAGSKSVNNISEVLSHIQKVNVTSFHVCFIVFFQCSECPHGRLRIDDFVRVL